ncbi:MAG: 3-hydroxyacyl-[acyl-carrier-protein] dehydratase FabZ [SAR324 cluster bacterium]|uniref:3-hydroxyacyl-[acyl-carrier-protein] dehydratase FabZ n=1 Tax=SAR324 cluster bacterium TaxID=2024889 RepID=A0A2A4T8D4_9DELT|nr:MAG: 3-hydroxyacyl-[acyl-carrier-protein] dehydratase FabZ [SAR324 cluster bacterium]
MILDILEIKKRLKHRYPFLMIDRVIELEEGVSCTAIKNITINEMIFQGHFPEQPIFPGVLIVEAMAQTAGIAGYALHKDPDNSLSYFAGFDKVRFRAPVVPGDQLVLKAHLVKQKMNIWFMQGKAYVDDKLVATAEFKLATVPAPK